MAQFADTSYFLALLIANDEKHGAAVALASGSGEAQVTTDWVLMEVGNHCRRRNRAGCLCDSCR